MTMFIHLNSDGTIAKVLHDRVIRRSNVNKIYVFAPFAPGSTVLIHFQKPNGELITGPMIFKEFNLANQINTWEYSLMNRTITDIAGKVLISLEIRAITEGGVEITATPNTHMWVEESIGELPEIEEVDEFLNLANLAMERVIALEEEFEETQLTEEDKVKLNNSPLNTIAELESKVDKVAGKGLSTNDYTNEDKAKVANLPEDTISELSDINDELTDRLHKTSDLATQQEAEEGQNVQKWMNPLRVKQAIEALVGEALDIFDLNGKIKVSLFPDSIVHSLEFRGTIASLEAIAINGNYFPTQLEKGWLYITSYSFSIANRLTTLDIPVGEEYDPLRSAWNGWTFTRYDADYAMTTNFLSGDMFIICDIDPTEKVIYFGYIDNNASDLYVPLTRQINGKSLSNDITLTTADINDTATRRYVTAEEKTKLNNLPLNTIAELDSKVDSVNGKVGTVVIDSGDIPFDGSGTNYLADKALVESAVKELDIQVKVLQDTKEVIANKAVDFSVVDDTKYPTTKAVKDLVDAISSGGGGGQPFLLQTVSNVENVTIDCNDIPYGKLILNVEKSYGWTKTIVNINNISASRVEEIIINCYNTNYEYVDSIDINLNGLELIGDLFEKLNDNSEDFPTASNGVYTINAKAQGHGITTIYLKIMTSSRHNFLGKMLYHISRS